MADKKLVMMSDRGLGANKQAFAEHPPILASKLGKAKAHLKQIRRELRGTYTDIKFHFVDADELTEYKSV
tara:strand:- start:1612 stop:1821 length:210 start_codon:yes stop_codon:yes gene_type:complete